MNDNIDKHREKLKLVPKKPGVYIMYDKDGRVIYVGKAKALYNRLAQYFIGVPNDKKTMLMVMNVDHFDYILTKSEKDALILENNLIKKYKPKYNILLKDDKTYPFIKVNMDVKYPYLSLVRTTKKDNNKYFGPFLNSNTINVIIDIVSSSYKLRRCRYDLKTKKKRACLNYHIGLCLAPCVEKITVDEYLKNVYDACDSLNNHLKNLIPVLKEKMSQYSDNTEFEKAAQLRDKIKIIENFANSHNVVTVKKIDLDVISFYRDGDISAVAILMIRQGIIDNKKTYTFPNTNEVSDENMVVSFLEQYYLISESSKITKRVVIDINTDFEIPCSQLTDTISKFAHMEVTVSKPRGDFTKNLLSVACLNAIEGIKLRLNTKIDDALFILKEKLSLNKFPYRIESYDISNTAGSNAVGVMTVFENGVLNNREKRSFIIKNENGSDDYASMFEVIDRRLNNLYENKENFSEVPDIILVDGGKGHVRVAQRAMEKYDFNIPIFGMVKNDKHKTKDLTNSACMLNIKENKEAFALICKIDEATHNNAIAYHKKKNTMTGTKSQLLDIPNVGKATMLKLYSEFKTITKIKNATLEELSKVIPKNAAKSVFEHFSEGTERD